MKTKLLLKDFFKVIMLLVFLGIGLLGFGQTSESFNNIPTVSSSSYISRTWTGDDTNTWSASLARTDQTITGKAICTNGTGSVTSSLYSGGMGVLEFSYVRGFTGTNARSFEVFVNSTKIGATVTVNASSNTVETYSQVINVPGNVNLEIKTAGDQIKIDNISWTSYSVSIPLISSSASNLVGFNYLESNGPSSSQSFNLSGTNLTGFADNITVTGSTNYEVSSDNVAFGTTATIHTQVQH